MIKFTYQEQPKVYCGEEKIVYTSTLLNDDMTTLTLEQHQNNTNNYLWSNCFIPPPTDNYIIEVDDTKEIFIKNTTIWNLLYNGDLIQRKLGYNLYKNTLKNNGNINN